MVSRNERMQEQRIYFGKELRIKLNFLWMLLICMAMVQITAAPSCRGHICLNWKIQNTRLVLICKVDALDFAITFYDPFDQETGFCVPYEPCIPLLHKAKITKNHTLHEIIVSIPLQMQLNGWWTCTYGDNNARAVTEVTLQNVPLQTINGIPANKECWTLMMLWCMLGFTCSFLPLRLFILFLTCDPQQVKEECVSCLNTDPQKGKDENEPCLEKDQRHEKKRLTKNCTAYLTSSHNSQVKGSKILIVTILSVTLFVVPVIVGLADQRECKAFKEFAIYGAIVGVIICVLLNTDKTNTNDTADKNDQDKTNTNGTADKNDQDKTNTNDTADKNDQDKTNTNDTADKSDQDKTNTNDTADKSDQDKTNPNDTADKSDQDKSNTNDTADKSDQDKTNTNDTADKSDQDKSNTNDTADKSDQDKTNTNGTVDKNDQDENNTNDTADKNDQDKDDTDSSADNNDKDSKSDNDSDSNESCSSGTPASSENEENNV